MIHKNRGNRRWVDKRKRRSKYNLAKRICDKIKDVIGKYDKGHIYDLNSKYKNKESSYDDYYKDGISHSDKKKVESCNDKYNYYATGVEYPFYKYICGVTGLTCCGCSLFCEHRREK